MLDANGCSSSAYLMARTVRTRPAEVWASFLASSESGFLKKHECSLWKCKRAPMRQQDLLDISRSIQQILLVATPSASPGSQQRVWLEWGLKMQLYLGRKINQVIGLSRLALDTVMEHPGTYDEVSWSLMFLLFPLPPPDGYLPPSCSL